MEFHLPELGEGVYEAEMSRWLVKEGDTVKPGQGLLEVLTDKATMEVPAPFVGTVDHFLMKEGDKIKVGQPVLKYTVRQGGSDTSTAAEPRAATPPERQAQATQPRLATAAPPAGNGNSAAVK